MLARANRVLHWDKIHIARVHLLKQAYPLGQWIVMVPQGDRGPPVESW